MSSPSAIGRRRGLPKQMSSEDQALNMIAREAEARLAAKRAARAEARSIRMKELEKKQKEADEQMDKEYEREYDDPTKRRANSSRVKSSATSSLNTSNSSLDEIGLHNDEYVKQLKDQVKEVEDKFRKAMVNSAQLDNERQAFQYQVECLKDIIEDLTENLDNVTDEFTHKSRDYNKLNRDHEKLEEEFNKCTKILTDRDRILDEHGINIDGSLKEQPDGDDDETDSPRPVDELRQPLTNHIGNSNVSDGEKESLLIEIENLKEELAEIRTKNEPDLTKREADTLRIEGGRAELERSFVDVSDEANAIQDDIRHQGLYVNNNEKCDEFEVIDNTSQQGGIHHFEDKSFERSGRSSLLSSVQTQVTESMESEKALEISVEHSHEEAQQKDEYDIVPSDDDKDITTSQQTLDISSMTASNERSQSPLPSDININKYFMASGMEDTDEELHTANTFSVDQYFALEEPATKKLEDELKDEKQNAQHDEMHFENIEAPELSLLNTVKEQDIERCSPYLEVDANLSSNKIEFDNNKSKTDSNDETFHAVSLEDIKKTPTSENNEADINDVSNTYEHSTIEGESNKIDTLNSSNVEISSTLDDSHISINNEDVDNSMNDQSELNKGFSSSDSLIDDTHIENTDTLDGGAISAQSLDENPFDNQASDNSNLLEENVSNKENEMNTEGTNDENALLDTLENNKPIVLKEGVFVENREPLKASVSLSDDTHAAVRQDVENLYDLIAGDSKSKEEVFNENSDHVDGLPSDATFGIFAQTTVQTENKDPVFGLVSQKDETSKIISEHGSTPSSPISPKKKEGWLVRVESFTAPKRVVANRPLKRCPSSPRMTTRCSPRASASRHPAT